MDTIINIIVSGIVGWWSMALAGFEFNNKWFQIIAIYIVGYFLGMFFGDASCSTP